MKPRLLALAALLCLCQLLILTPARADDCVTCHEQKTPGAVADWRASKHAGNDVGCTDCHGSSHKTATDAKQAKLPTPDTCGKCHEDRVAQFKKGKHAFAWTAMKAMPTAHYWPLALTQGFKGCGGCHKIGLKSEDDMKELHKAGSNFGTASCDACHTRHTFSIKEARQPESCQTCHMGFDHPHWEMYESSKHGVRNKLKRDGVLPPSSSAPTCQQCHMQGGNHEVRTGWGFLALRLPLSKDKQWAADQATILQGLGVLDPKGNPTARLELVKAADVVRLTEEDFQKQRTQMIQTCTQCHSEHFAREQLERGDEMIKNADHLMAQGIRIVAGLYKDGTLRKPKSYAFPFPDLLTFFDAPTLIEQTLHTMFLEHRMRTFQGTFHSSPDYALWYGWNELNRDLAEIRELAEQYRLNAARAPKAPTPQKAPPKAPKGK